MSSSEKKRGNVRRVSGAGCSWAGRGAMLGGWGEEGHSIGNIRTTWLDKCPLIRVHKI